MKIGILSDTHIGKSLKTNTTLNSRKLLKQSIFDTASDALSTLEDKVDCIIHTADLFDSASNDEQDIRDAAAIANRCDIVMFGNHDVRNRTDSLSSIDLLASLSVGGMKPWYLSNRWTAGCDILPLSVTGSAHKVEGYFVTHCDSQETFEASLNVAKDSAKIEKEDGLNVAILFLHANYDNDLTTGKEQNLNLTADTAEDLLEVFDFIIMGHEHQYAERFEGRVISVGTTHPTSFSDVSDKFCVVIDTEARSVEKFCTWSSLDRSISVDVADFLAGRFSAGSAQFIDVTGTTDAKDAAAVNDAVSEVWSENENHLIALRTSKIEYVTETSDDHQEVTSLESLPEVMLSELTGSAKDLMAEALKSVEQ